MKSRWSMPLCQGSIPSSRHRRSSTSSAPKSPPSWSLKVSMMIYQWSWRAPRASMRLCPCLEYRSQSAQKYLPLWLNGAPWSKICKVRQTSTFNEPQCLIKIKCHQEQLNLPKSQACSSKLAQGPMLTSSCTCKQLDSQNKHRRRCLERR